MENKTYGWTDNPTVSGISQCDTDVLNECLMYLRYNIVSGRNIGDIFYTMRKEAGSLNGAYDCTGIELSEADFEEGNSNPYTLLVNNILPWVSYEDYEAQIQANNGTCGVFALDTEYHKFKTPTLKEVYIEADSAAKIGDYISEVRANITVSTNGSSAVSPKTVCYRPMIQLANIVNDKVSVESYTNRIEEKTNEGINALSNVSNAVLQTSITNCLLSVPKRLNIDCSNNMLTIKAGSVVTIPNGFEEDGTTPKFDYRELSSDIIVNYDTTAQNLMISLTTNSTGVVITEQANCYSSDTAPDSSNNVKFWYDKTNNRIKCFTTDSQDYSLISFPVCVVDCIAEDEFEIKHIFDSTGFIGLTVWADKGIRCLIPAGKNSNGSLNSIDYTIPYCLTADLSNTDTCVVIDSNGVLTGGADYDLFKDTHCFIASFSILSGQIEYWKQPQALELLKRNDIPELCAISLPSDRYIDLTLGASGSQYTAPADGWINLVKMSNATNQDMVFETFNNSTLSRYLVAYCPRTTSNIALLVPVSKNEKFSIRYTAGGATNTFKFIYAQGAPSV